MILLISTHSHTRHGTQSHTHTQETGQTHTLTYKARNKLIQSQTKQYRHLNNHTKDTLTHKRRDTLTHKSRDTLTH